MMHSKFDQERKATVNKKSNMKQHADSPQFSTQSILL